MNCRPSNTLVLPLELFLSLALVFGSVVPGLNPPLPQSTWEPPHLESHGKLTAAQLKKLPDSAFAFPGERKEPLTDAAHIRSALARFNRLKGVTDAERDLAFANIRKAAAYFGVKMKATDWHQLGQRPNPRRTAPEGESPER